LLARFDHTTFTPQQSTSFYHSDGKGNVTALMNTNQMIVARYEYDPFGNLLSLSGPLSEANSYRFSSKEFHAQSDLVRYLFRNYQPNIQRWCNRDPLRELGFTELSKCGLRGGPWIGASELAQSIIFNRRTYSHSTTRSIESIQKALMRPPVTEFLTVWNSLACSNVVQGMTSVLTNTRAQRHLGFVPFQGAAYAT
jgi:RHS repeat-associated protein